MKITKIAEKNNELLIKLGKNISARMFLEELLISSFIPEGYLSEKYLKTIVIPFKSKPRDLLEWRKFIAYKLYKITGLYLKNYKIIDEDYLRDLLGAIKY